jgi:hypothetical protein
LERIGSHAFFDAARELRLIGTGLLQLFGEVRLGQARLLLFQPQFGNALAQRVQALLATQSLLFRFL